MRSTAAVVALSGLCGCGTLVSSATSRLAGDLSTALLNQADVQTARDGLPAFLLLIDGLIESQPESSDLLLAGARLYGAYASAFAADEARAQRLSERARGYGLRALCAEARALCERVAQPYEAFAEELAQTNRGDVDALYGFGAAWAVWVQARAGDWSAVAELPKIQALRWWSSTRATTAALRTPTWACSPRSSRPLWAASRSAAGSTSSGPSRSPRAAT
jgi:hypothetical protein